MCQPPDGTLQKLQKLVREKVAPLKKNPAGVDPAEVACEILEELGAGSVLRDFPEVWASAHYNFQQLIRADLRRKPLALVPPTTSSEEGMIVQLGLPGFEEAAIHGWADPDVGYDEPMADIG